MKLVNTLFSWTCFEFLMKSSMRLGVGSSMLMKVRGEAYNWHTGMLHPYKFHQNQRTWLQLRTAWNFSAIFQINSSKKCAKCLFSNFFNIPSLSHIYTIIYRYATQWHVNYHRKLSLQSIIPMKNNSTNLN